MKIIKSGKKQPALLRKKITCSECKCRFQLESKSEAKFVSDQRDGDYYEIRCPQCRCTGTYATSLFSESSVE